MTPYRKPTPPRAAGQPSAMTPQADRKWLTILAVPVLIGSALLGIYAIWGALFIYWGMLTAREGTAFIFEPVERNEDPILFWIIVAMWIGSGLIYIAVDLAGVI